MIQLKRYEPEHLEGIFENVSPDGLIGGSFCNTKEQFAERIYTFANFVFADFYSVICDGVCKGCAYLYEYRPDDRHAKMLVEAESLHDEEWNKVVLAMLERAASSLPLRKVFYKTVNPATVEKLLSIAFENELTLTNHKYINGLFADMHILSITK